MRSVTKMATMDKINNCLELTPDEAFLIWVENVICRNFTKRQIKILGFVFLFALHHKRLDCYIPTLISFEAAGVSRHKIKNEIEKLEELNVLSWDRERMTFRILSDTTKWKVDYTTNYSKDKITQISILNNPKILD